MSYIIAFIAFILKMCVFIYSVAFIYYGLETEENYDKSRENKRLGQPDPYDAFDNGIVFTLVQLCFWMVVAGAYEWNDISPWLAIFFTTVLSHIVGEYTHMRWAIERGYREEISRLNNELNRLQERFNCEELELYQDTTSEVELLTTDELVQMLQDDEGDLLTTDELKKIVYGDDPF